MTETYFFKGVYCSYIALALLSFHDREPKNDKALAKLKSQLMFQNNVPEQDIVNQKVFSSIHQWKQPRLQPWRRLKHNF